LRPHKGEKGLQAFGFLWPEGKIWCVSVLWRTFVNVVKLKPAISKEHRIIIADNSAIDGSDRLLGCFIIHAVTFLPDLITRTS
jgi:hypothetical protein